MLRSDNGIVFGAKPFVAVVNRWKLEQEYIVPYTPEQNGMIERFFGSMKSECVCGAPSVSVQLRPLISPSTRPE